MTQLLKKFIAPNAVDESKIRLSSGGALRARNAANTADLALLQSNGSDVPEFQILPAVAPGLPIPTSAKQLATIEYIKNYLEGKADVKNAVAYLATSNISGTFTAGTATAGATLISTTAALTIDGKTFAAADVSTTYPMRVALIGQTAGLQNGIYDVTAAGNNSFTLTRSFDFSTVNNASGQEVTQGAWWRVTSGTAYSGYECQLTTADPITLDTTALTIVAYPSALNLTAGDGLVKNGNVFSINLLANGGLVSTNPGVAGGQIKVKTDSAPLEKDQTTRLDPTNSFVAAKKFKKGISNYTLTATDISNQYLDLPDVAADSSVQFDIAGAPAQIEGLDYTINYTGGAGSKTRLTFAGGLASAGASALVAGDVVTINYGAF